MNFERRLTGLQENMEEKGIDLAIYGSCQNFQYLTGLPIEWRRGRDLIQPEDNVFVPREGNPILTLSKASAGYAEDSWMGDTRVLEGSASYSAMVGKVASDLGWDGGRIGVGANLWGSTWLEAARAFKGARFRRGEALMDHLRMIKEPAEIELLRKVAELTDEAMEKIVSGKLNRWYSEFVLLEQPFVKDDKKAVDQVLKAMSPDLTVTRFVRYEVGGV